MTLANMENDQSELPRVLLLKDAEDEGGIGDALMSVGLDPVYFPVLSYRYIHQDALRQALKEVDTVSGVVITSARAWMAVADLLNKESDCFQQVTHSAWRHRPLFAPAAKTANVVANLDILIQKEQIRYPVEGQGNADALATFILQEHEAFKRGDGKPLLFLCGAKAMPTLPRRLGAERIKQLAVYESVQRDLMDADFANALRRELGTSRAIVFYSPSGVECVLRGISDFVTVVQKKGIVLAAIGQTTRKALDDAMSLTYPDFQVSILVPNRPDNPSELASLLKERM